MRIARILFCCVAVVLALSGVDAFALVDVNFTPVHLAEDSDVILLGRIEGEAADSVTIVIIEALSGEAPERIEIDLTTGERGHIDMVRQQLRAASGQLAMLFAGTYGQGADEEEAAYLHFSGQWLRLVNVDGNWELYAIDAARAGTWAGGTDMLLLCIRYIIDARGGALVPVDSGTRWEDFTMVAQTPRPVAAARAVDLAGDGNLSLFVASVEGDMLFKPTAPREQFADLTAESGLASKSKLFAWSDLTRNGRLDLASWDGESLTLHLQDDDGRFASREAGVKLQSCVGLAAIDLGVPAKPAIVAVGDKTLTLMRWDGNGEASVTEIGLDGEEEWGSAHAPIVADFNNSSLPDVIVPFQRRNGLLFAGLKDGSLAAAARCGVFTGPGTTHFDVGDFDGDGYLDIVIASGDAVRIFQNMREGNFVDKLGLSGEVSYKTQPGATAALVCDFNVNGRQDLVLGYGITPPMIYFNRGFRSFGQAPDLEMSLATEVPGAEQGLLAIVMADFHGLSVHEMLMITHGGEIWLASNELAEFGVMRLLASLSPDSGLNGPIRVRTYHGERLVGAWSATRASGGAFIGLEGEGIYTLRWQLPGGQEMSHRMVIEGESARVLLDKAGKAAE